MLETKVYSEEYYGGYVDPDLEIAAKTNTYDLYLLTYIDTPWEKDDLRDRPEQRIEMFKAFENALKKYNRPYVLLNGDKNYRFKTAVFEIDKILQSKHHLQRFSDDLIDLDLHFLHHQNLDSNIP